MSTLKKIILIEPRGFCIGVKQALEIVQETLHKYSGQQIFVINEIVHNKTIVADLKEQGVIFTQDIHTVPDGAVVILSAHGVAPQVREYFRDKNITVIDATCQLVDKVHQEVKEYSRRGYHIIYIGNKNHDEARGVIAENPENISVVENESDIANIKKGYANYIILNQTTLNMLDVEKLITRIKNSYANVQLPSKNDLCYATTSRQTAVRRAAEVCDLVLVIGSQNSSNSKKLKEIATHGKTRAYLIDNCTEIKPEWLADVFTLGITSGTSAPDKLVKECVTYLIDKYGFVLSEK